MKFATTVVFGLAILACHSLKPAEPLPLGVQTGFAQTKNESQSVPSVKVEAEFKVGGEEKPVSIAPQHCQDGMSYIDLDYCSDVKEECDVWLDPPGTKFARCKKFKPSVCVGQWTRKTFCMDQYEYAEPDGVMPKVNVSGEEAEAICKSNGKRLCTETEFETACESGPNREIHAYFTGFERPSNECNIDRLNLLNEHGKLRDYRVPVKGTLHCANPFTGVYNLTGNVDEFYLRDRTIGPYKVVLKGGWWAPIRSRCRPSTVSHSETNYWSVSVGMRCCSDSK